MYRFRECCLIVPEQKCSGFQKWSRLVKMMKIIRIFARVFRDKMRFLTRCFLIEKWKKYSSLLGIFEIVVQNVICPGLGSNISGNVWIGQKWSGHTNNTQWYSRQMYRNRTVTHNFVSISLCVYLPSKKFQSELPIQTENQLNWRRTILRVSIENE